MPFSYIRSTISFSSWQALEVGDVRVVARLDQGVEAGLHQLGEAAAQHHLLAEEVGLGLLGERGLDDARAGAADALRVGQRQVPCALPVASCGDGDQARACRRPPAYVRRTRCPGPLGATISTSTPAGRDDLAEVDGEAVREQQRVALAEAAGDVLGEERGPAARRARGSSRGRPRPPRPPPQHLEALAPATASVDADPGRRPTTTFTPESRRFSACAWPWLP